MKTHEHIFISLGYAAGASLLATGTLGNWGVYIAALVGGELIDFIDHPLYHLVYRRKDAVVQQGFRELRQKGIKEYFNFLKQAEDNREFDSLMLHNILAISLIALIGVFCALWLPSPIYSFVALGAFILHMLTDLYGDFRLNGHTNNWLWVLTPKALDRIGKIGLRFVFWVWSWWAFILFAFLFVSFRWVWQMCHLGAYWGLAYEAITSPTSVEIWITSAPLLLLICYFLMVLALIFAGSYKYNLEISGSPRTHIIKPKSINALCSLVTGKTPRIREEFDRLLLKMQADMAVWILVLSSGIALSLLFLSWFKVDTPLVIILIATVPALTFGTLIHTTIGEFGGVLGVLLAALLNMIFSRFSLQEAWPPIIGLVLFTAAVGAWVLGLMGGIFLKGQRRMSLVIFLVQIKNHDPNIESVEWFKNLVQVTRNSLKQGYQQARKQLFGGKVPLNILDFPEGVVMLPNSGMPLLFKNYIHFCAKDNFSPLLNQTAYVLCNNRLMEKSRTVGEFGLLPVLPNYRFMDTNLFNGEAHWENGLCHWHSKDRKVILKSSQEENSVIPKNGNKMLSIKLFGDYFDDMVTRRVDLLTDLYIFPHQDCNEVTICGVGRAKTSTKEYASIEAETYSGWVQHAILDAVKDKNLGETRKYSARLFYPQISQFDQGLETFSAQNGIPMLMSQDECYWTEETKILNQALDLLPTQNQIFSVSSDFHKRLLVLAIQVAFTIVLYMLGLDPKVIDLLGNVF